jgi:hypothetical protein
MNEIFDRLISRNLREKKQIQIREGKLNELENTKKKRDLERYRELVKNLRKRHLDHVVSDQINNYCMNRKMHLVEQEHRLNEQKLNQKSNFTKFVEGKTNEEFQEYLNKIPPHKNFHQKNIVSSKYGNSYYYDDNNTPNGKKSFFVFLNIIYLFIYLFICLFVYLFICLFVYLFFII